MRARLAAAAVALAAGCGPLAVGAPPPAPVAAAAVPAGAAAPPAPPAAVLPPQPSLPALSVPGEADSTEVFRPEPVALPEPAALPVARRIEMRATAYCLRGNMRTGVPTRNGMAAGDPSVLPLGSVVRVSHPDGRPVGIFVIMDTGGSVRGNRIDLWFASCAEARQWGVRTVVAEVVEIGRS